MATARIEELLQLHGKNISSVDAVICILTVSVLKSLVMWTDLFNVMANSNGHANKDREIAFICVHTTSQSTFFAEHMVCWTSAQYPHWLCVTGLLPLAKLTVPACVICNTITCVGHIESF